MDVVNPATGEREEMYEEDTREDVDAALDRATSAFGEWRDRPIHTANTSSMRPETSFGRTNANTPRR